MQKRFFSQGRKSYESAVPYSKNNNKRYLNTKPKLASKSQSSHPRLLEPLPGLSLQILAHRGQQPSHGLQALLVCGVLDQLDQAAVHDPHGQHLELVQLADEADVAKAASGIRGTYVRISFIQGMT